MRFTIVAGVTKALHRRAVFEVEAIAGRPIGLIDVAGTAEARFGVTCVLILLVAG